MQFTFFSILLAFMLLINFTYTGAHGQTNAKYRLKNLSFFGAQGDGITNNSVAISAALQACDTVIISPGIYLFGGVLKFKKLSNITIIADERAVMKNTDNGKGSFEFEDCNHIAISGGTWTRLNKPSHIGSGEEHTFKFIHVVDLKILKTHIIGSPEMGIALSEVIGAVIDSNVIENCYRDGIYAHYSTCLTYSNNIISNIKDDALSIHDYGLDAQKPFLLKNGYKQAGCAKIINNSISNCYQGISSIGAQNVFINNNKVSNTVNAGIAVFNSENLFKAGTSRVYNIQVTNNQLYFNGGDTYIMGILYKNGGQLTTGRSAIFIAALDTNNLINNPHSTLKNITFSDNSIYNCYVNGTYLSNINNLTFTNNVFKNCNTDNNPLCGNIVEIRNSINASINTNTVIENRNSSRHSTVYEIINTTGKMDRWHTDGYQNLNRGKLIGQTPKLIP